MFQLLNWLTESKNRDFRDIKKIMFWPILEAFIVIQANQMILLKLFSLEQNAQ